MYMDSSAWLLRYDQLPKEVSIDGKSSFDQLATASSCIPP